jgi:hypothetical protein
MLEVPRAILDCHSCTRGKCPTEALLKVEERIGFTGIVSMCLYVFRQFKVPFEPVEPIDGIQHLEELEKLICSDEHFTKLLYVGLDCNNRRVIRLREDVSIVDRALVINFLWENRPSDDEVMI